MTNPTVFESRYGKASGSAREVFSFVTDMRNFSQFVPQNSIRNWHAEIDTCSFTVNMIGNVSVRLSEKAEYSEVKFEGDAFKKEDFNLTLNIYENTPKADFKILVAVELNPMMKMLAVKPINQFLETLVTEMEKFKGWNDVK
jgi:hypothetical protein